MDAIVNEAKLLRLDSVAVNESNHPQDLNKKLNKL